RGLVDLAPALADRAHRGPRPARRRLRTHRMVRRPQQQGPPAMDAPAAGLDPGPTHAAPAAGRRRARRDRLRPAGQQPVPRTQPALLDIPTRALISYLI